MRFYGINNTTSRCDALATALSYWVFKCRDRKSSPAMGVKTWSFLESSIQNAGEVSSTIEQYLQGLAVSLASHLRPAELTKIVSPTQRIIRINSDYSEMQELEVDQEIVFVGWRDLIVDMAADGFSEWDLLESFRTKPGIIQVLCRLRFEEDRALGQDIPDEALEVSVNA